MIEVKRLDTHEKAYSHGMKVSVTLSSRPLYFTEAAAIELRDKLTAVLPSTTDKPDIGMFATEQSASEAYLNALHTLNEQKEGAMK